MNDTEFRPLVSILVPAYNSEPWIKRCLESLRKQTYENIEVLIYNDGSTDNSESIFAEIIDKDKRFRLIGNIKVGISKARNNLLEAANGFASIFIDSDDYIESNMIEFLLSYMIRDNLDLCGCSAVCIKEDGVKFLIANPAKGYSIYNKDELILQYLRLTLLHGNLWTKLIRTDLLKKLQFKENWNYAEDSDFIWRLLKLINKAGLSDRPLYHYILNKGSLSEWKFNAEKLKFIESWDNILKDVEINYPQFYNQAKISYAYIHLSVLHLIFISDSNHTAIERSLAQKIKHISIPINGLAKLDLKTILFLYGVRHSWRISRFFSKLWNAFRVH
ncbi:MAG: glycosyltransferase [Clostridium sp.]|nr:glycosyltransferase [Clostridium sp.]